MKLPLRIALIIALILIAGAGATPASAGLYQVYACHPDHGNVNNSWQSFSNRRGILVYAACTGHKYSLGPWDKGLVTRAMVNRKDKRATIPRGAAARWKFTAPPGASLLSVNYIGSYCGKYGLTATLQADLFPMAWWYDPKGVGRCSTTPRLHSTPLLLKTTASLRTYCTGGRCAVGGGTPRAWATMRSIAVVVYDNTLPSITVTGGSGVATGWKRGTVDVQVRAFDNTGVRYARIDGAGVTHAESEATCDYTRPAPCTDLVTDLNVNTRTVPDGAQPFVLHAQDTAGNWGTQPVTLKVDNTAPGPPINLATVGGTQWRSSNSFAVQWRNPSQTGTAPIAGVRAAVCPASADIEDWTNCLTGQPASPSGELAGIEVPRSGMWVARVWLQDEAGNEDRQTAQSVQLNFDDTPPVVGIAPMDTADPTRIDVRASDPTSPLVQTELEARRSGDPAWITLPTTATPTGFASRLDDETLPDGRYELRARVVDSAGNERSTTRELSGDVALRTVPLRVNTHLIAGELRIVKGRRTRGGRRRTRRVIIRRPMVRFGRTMPIHGRLTSAGDNAIANAALEVWERLHLRGATSRRVAVIGTDKSGRFTFRALPGPSRTLRFRYPGTTIVRARATEVELRVKAASTIGVSRRRVVNGEDIVLRGRVRGGPLPSVGKLLQLQAYSRGRWLTFATPRADGRTGRWFYRYRFTATRGTVRYRFRARIPQENGFPYAAGVSRSVRVLVRGL